MFSLVDLFQYIVSLAGITEEEYNDMSRSFSPEFNQKHQTVVEAWFSRGLEEGLQKGLQKGRQEGLRKGRQEGRQEGQAEAFQQVIRNMLKRFPDWSDQAIASALGIEIEPVAAERAKMKAG